MTTAITQMTDADLLVMLCGDQGRVLSKRSLPEIFGFGTPIQGTLFAAESVTAYAVNPQVAAAKELYIRALQADMSVNRISMTQPQSVKDYLRGKLSHLEHEVFLVLFMDTKNRLISSEEMFRGTLNQTSVYPREIVKRAIALNAASVIFSHNHPSGDTQPSRADEHLTRILKESLALIDIRVMDHIIIGGNKAISFAELGLI